MCSIAGMDLEHLRTFASVVRFGSLTRAGASLGLPKSTVSRHLSELEQQTSTQLITRTTRRLSVTDAGRRLFLQIEGPITELEQASRTIRDLSGEPRGLLRLTAPADVEVLSIVPMLESFLLKYPEVKLVANLTNRKVDLIAEGYELALRAGPLPPSGLIAKKLFGGEFHLFAKAEYLEKHGTPKSASDLASHQCLVFSDDRPQGKWVLWSNHQPSKRYEVSVSGRLALTEMGALARACAAGLGIALLPSQATRTFLPEQGVVRVLPKLRGPDSLLYAVYPPTQQVSPTLRALLNHLSAEFQKLTGTGALTRFPVIPLTGPSQ